MNLVRLAFIACTTSLFLLSCAHYDPLIIEQLSRSHQNDVVITKELCADFYEGAKALREGPEKAWPLLGRAREIDDLNIVMRKQGAACYEAEARDLSETLEERALKALKQTFLSAERTVKP